MQKIKIGGATLILVGLMVASAAAIAGDIERVSIASDGAEANDGSYAVSVSGDGGLVAFHSFATNLIDRDRNLSTDVFLHDRATNVTQAVNVDARGRLALGGNSYGAAIAGSGNAVAFHSAATNLVRRDRNQSFDVFVRDLVVGATERVSVASDGTEADGPSEYASISADGRYVVFHSRATNLIAGDANLSSDVFLHDRSTGVTERISESSLGAEASGDSLYPAISSDGRVVAFQSDAANLVPGDTNGQTDVFVHELASGVTSRVNISSAGDQTLGAGSYLPDISADGRSVSFHTAAANVVPGDSNGHADTFVHDRLSSATARASISTAGAEGDGASVVSSISGDGRYVSFRSHATDLVAGDINAQPDILLRDLVDGETVRVSTTSAGGGFVGSGAYGADISADGRVVGFHAGAGNLVSGDANLKADVFVKSVSP